MPYARGAWAVGPSPVIGPISFDPATALGAYQELNTYTLVQPCPSAVHGNLRPLPQSHACRCHKCCCNVLLHTAPTHEVLHLLRHGPTEMAAYMALHKYGSPHQEPLRDPMM